MKDYKKLEDKLRHAKIVRVEPLEGSSRLDKRLTPSGPMWADIELALVSNG
jgi:hypothetical protein